jgi:hypothetical protein
MTLPPKLLIVDDGDRYAEMALQALASVPKTPSSLTSTPPVRRGAWLATAPATEVATAQSTVSGLVENGLGKQRPPTPHPHRPGIPLPIRKPIPPKPICDGRDPLCGLTINSLAP